jgi:hypothetical protein
MKKFLLVLNFAFWKLSLYFFIEFLGCYKGYNNAKRIAPCNHPSGYSNAKRIAPCNHPSSLRDTMLTDRNTSKNFNGEPVMQW